MKSMSMWRSIAARVDRWHWVWVVVAAPFLLFPSPAVVSVLLVVPALWVLAWSVGEEALPRTPLNGILLLLSVMILVSLFATFDIAFNLNKISGILLGVSVFFAIVRWLDRAERLGRGLLGFLFGGSAFALLGLLGTQWSIKIEIFQAVINRLPLLIRGLPGAVEGFHPNAVAGILLLFLPLQIVFLLDTVAHRIVFEKSEIGWLCGSWGITIQLASLTLTFGVFLLTQSRGAWLGFGLVLLVLLGWHSSLTRRWLGVVILGVALLAFVMGPQRLFALAFNDSGNIELGWAARVELWSRAIYGIEDFPFTGVGIGNFRYVMPIMYPAFLTSPDFDVAHAHNHLLQAALDLGVLGLVSYLALWLGVAVMLLWVYCFSRNNLYRTVAIGLGAGLIAHFIFSMTDTIPLGTKAGVVFWATLGLSTGMFKVAYRNVMKRNTSPAPKL